MVREGTQEQLKRPLAGDLDNIVLKALGKEAYHRYDSVDEFAEDLSRHLQGLRLRPEKAKWLSDRQVSCEEPALYRRLSRSGGCRCFPPPSSTKVKKQGEARRLKQALEAVVSDGADPSQTPADLLRLMVRDAPKGEVPRWPNAPRPGR